MVTEWLMSLAVGFVGWFLDTFGSWDPPAMFTTARSSLIGVLNNFVGLGVWVDFAVVGTCFAVVAGAFLTQFIVKGARWVLGLFPTMGGGS